MIYADYLTLIRYILGPWVLLELWVGFFLVIYNFYQRRIANTLIAAPLVILSYFIFQCDGYILFAKEEKIAAYITKLPLAVMITVLTLITVVEVQQVYNLIHWQRNHISSMSVKYAVDTISVGICYYDENGCVRLKNKAIDNVYRRITGEALTDGNAFQRLLEAQKSRGNIRFDELLGKGIVVFENNDAVAFSFMEAEDRGKKLTLLTSIDITGEYVQIQTLSDKQKQVTELNSKLRQYNREIVSTIAAKEILDAKVKIHDEMGAGLLKAKRYLSGHKEEINKQDIVDTLLRNIQYLKQETKIEITDEYTQILNAAEKLNVKINIIGMLPGAEVPKHIVVTALHECITNTLRHAKGDEVTMTISETEEGFKAVYTNNGIQPESKLKETGGLASLRKLVEESKGIMNIEIKNGFELSILLPKEVNEYGI